MKIISEVKDAKKIAIGGHVRPDGDCVCSVMALYRYLQKELPETQIDVYLETVEMDLAMIFRGFHFYPAGSV